MGQIKVFSIILSFIYGVIILAVTPGGTVPITGVDIVFEVEVSGGVKVEPVYLDFGNILKNSNKKQTSIAYFNISNTYIEDILVTTSYQDGIIEGDYTKIKVPKKGESISENNLDVYLYNLKAQKFSAGTHKIPVIGEIREVGNISLGIYEKTIKMDVTIQPISSLK